MPKLQILPAAEWAASYDECKPILDQLMARGGPIAIDTETTGLDVVDDRVLFWSMATDSRRFCFPVDALYYFLPLFDRKDIVWYLANAKFDMHMLANHGVQLAGDKWDIVVMDALEDDTRSHGLKDQGRRDFGANWGEFKDLFIDADYLKDRVGLGKSEYTRFKKLSTGDKLMFIFDEDPTIVIDYASCDAYFTYKAAQQRARVLSMEELPTDIVPEMKTLLDYFKIIEVPFTQVLWEMERNGAPLSEAKLRELDEPMRYALRACQSRMEKVLHANNVKIYAKKSVVDSNGKRVRVDDLDNEVRFNPASPEHLSAVLFGDHGFKQRPVKQSVSEKTGKVSASVDEDVINALLERKLSDSLREFLLAYKEYKTVSKLHGTYVRDVKKKHLRNGKIHCSFNQAGARTGRLSSSNPNLQNIPARSDLGKKIREAFVPSPGCKLIVADYPQIEFRIAAVLAGEQKMMDAFHRGWDIHSANTAVLFGESDGITYEMVVEAQRKKDAKEPLTDFDKLCLRRRNESKTAGLATLYGKGVTSMAADLGCDVDHAREIQNVFKGSYENITAFEENIKDFAYEHGYTFTMLGRKRRLYHITDHYNRGKAAAEERQALNTCVQGSGAEMMKLAMLRCHFDEEFRRLGARLLITVHDELVAEAPEANAKRAHERMCELMADPYRWGPIQIDYPVPIDPDGSIGDSWAEAK